MGQKSRRLRLLVGIAIALVAVVPSGVLAAERFGDVPETSPIHADVEALASAGIVRGCGSAENYCPEGTVTRGQMAQYLHRSMPSVSAEEFWGPLSGSAQAAVATIDVDVPGRIGGHQYVRLDANTLLRHAGGTCYPCGAFFHLKHEGGEQTVPRELFLAHPSDAREGTYSGVFRVASGTTANFTLFAVPSHSLTPLPSYTVSGELIAETFPVGEKLSHPSP
jgi:hypothetical protein